MSLESEIACMANVDYLPLFEIDEDCRQWTLEPNFNDNEYMIGNDNITNQNIFIQKISHNEECVAVSNRNKSTQVIGESNEYLLLEGEGNEYLQVISSYDANVQEIVSTNNNHTQSTNEEKNNFQVVSKNCDRGNI